MGCCAPTQNHTRQYQPYETERRPIGAGPEMPVREQKEQQHKEQLDVVDQLPVDPKLENSLSISVVKERSPTPSILKRQGIYPSRRTTINFNKIMLKRKKTMAVRQPAVPPPDIEKILTLSRRFTEARRKAESEGKEIEVVSKHDSDSDLSVGSEEQYDDLDLKISQKISENDRKPSHVRHIDNEEENQRMDRKATEVNNLVDNPPGYEMFYQEAEDGQEMGMIRKIRVSDEKERNKLYTGNIFKDPDFKHDDASIFDAQRNLNPKLDNLEWKRARDIIGEKFLVLPENDEQISPTNIKQGSLGDCYLLSALSALAEWPQRIRSLFITQEPNEAGVYIVRLYLNGSSTEIAVDQFFPCKGDRFAFCRNSDDNTIWPLLIEKAYAKVFGSYQRIQSGTLTESLQLLTCSYIDIINHSEASLSELWLEIGTAIQHQFVILSNVSAGGEEDQEILEELGLVDNHAYTIIGANQIRDKEGELVRLIRVRNPWGQGQWEGDWSDKSDKWTPQLREQLNVKEEDDGIFFINLQNFAKFFHNTTIAKFNDKWGYSLLRTPMQRGEFRVAHLKLNETSNVQLLYFQPGLRFLTGLLDQEFNFDLLNLAVMRYQPDGKYSWVPIKDFQRKINCSCTEGTLEAGSYLIFLQIQQEQSKSTNTPVHSWFVLRSEKPVARLAILEKPEPLFLSKMVRACCISKGVVQEYDNYSGVTRFFSLSDSLTSLGGFLYQTMDQDMVFQQRLKYQINDGIQTLPLLLNPNTILLDDGFEVSLKPEEEEVIVLKQAGQEETKFSYKFSTRGVLSDEELKFRINNGEGGKPYQIEDYMTQQPLQIYVKSYFTIEKGMLLVDNKEKETTVEFTFDFKGSTNLRIRGVKAEDGLSTNIKSRPGSVVGIIVETINPWESMPIAYTYSFQIF